MDYFPHFNEARGETASMQLIPPFHFTGVTMRVFPLRANRYLLQRFIDQQLNIIPPEAGSFRVFLPYIYLIIVNYGRMSVEAANLGWISQNEVAFSVPLIWRRQVNGKWMQEFAYVSPFIYVDNPLSMTTGREVYGWPKMMASFDPQLSAWMDNPTNRIQQASMSVDMVREAYSGARSTRCTLMEVDAAPIPTFAQVPFDVRNPLMPWNTMRKAIYTSSALFGDSLEIFRGVLEEFVAGQAREGIGGQLERAIKSPSTLGIMNTVNLKQFRDAQNPELFCYQALTNTPMTLKSFRRGGMLGDLRTLGGDVTGGYRIRIHNYDTQPIVSSLGLEVASTADIEGTNVSNLLPVFPFWLEVDLEYPLASVLAWRAKGSPGWHHDGLVTPTKCGPRFNTAQGAGGADIAGPYQFPDATVRVMPLLADEAKLDAFIDAYLNQTIEQNTDPEAESRSFFKAWGRYVYLIVFNDERSFSESNNVGELATRQARLCIPVKWYQQNGKHQRLVSTALVPVYSYANSAGAAISLSSIAGVPTMTAELDSPPNTWLDCRGPSSTASDEYMVLRGDVLPVLNLGQQATVRTIIECDNIEPLPSEDVHGWQRLADRWATGLKREQQRKRELVGDQLCDAKALALELLANGASFDMVTLKQFRSATNPQQACYQALVLIPGKIEQLTELEEIETPLHVRIHEYPSQAMVSTLGLVVKDWQQGGGSRIAVIEPCRPFWLRGHLRQDLGTNIHVWPTPTGQARWTEAPEHSSLLTKGSKLSPDLIDQIEDGRPQYLSGQVIRWLQKPEAQRKRLTAKRVRAAVEAVEPQIVIESVLSNEWEAWFDPRWRRGEQYILERVRRATASSFPSEVTKKTAETLCQIRDKLLASVDDRKLGMAPHRNRLVEQDLEIYVRLADLLASSQACDEHLQAVARLSAEAANEARDHRHASDHRLLTHVYKLREAMRADDADTADPELAEVEEAMDDMYEALGEVFEHAEHEMPELDIHMVAALDERDRARIVTKVRAMLEELRNALVLQLAKSWQKPDLCIRRQTVVHHCIDQYFPQAESFDEHWYYGPDGEPQLTVLGVAADVSPRDLDADD